MFWRNVQPPKRPGYIYLSSNDSVALFQSFIDTQSEMKNYTSFLTDTIDIIEDLKKSYPKFEFEFEENIHTAKITRRKLMEILAGLGEHCYQASLRVTFSITFPLTLAVQRFGRLLEPLIYREQNDQTNRQRTAAALAPPPPYSSLSL